MNRQALDVAFYWTPEEAAAILDYLDRLRDQVWEHYGDDIIELRGAESSPYAEPHSAVDDAQQFLEFDEDIDF